MEIGKYIVNITVENIERGKEWISGDLTATFTEADFTSRSLDDVEVEVGCDPENDDDYDSWASWMEGAKIIASLWKSEDIHLARKLMPTACEALGGIICATLRGKQ